MKKLVLILSAVSFMAACNNSSTSGGSSDSSSTSTNDTSSATTTPPAMSPDTSATAGTAGMKDGVMTMKDGKMMVMKNGNWKEMKEDMTCTNGVKVKTSGEITKGTRSKKLTDGLMIDNDGQLTDANGKSVDNAGW